MTHKAPKVAFVLQALFPVSLVLWNILTLPSMRSEAETLPGPPYYLPFEALVVIVSIPLFSITFLLWKRSLFALALSLCIDCLIAVTCCYSAGADFFSRIPTSVAADAILLTVAAFFGLIVSLLVSKPTLDFFGLWITANGKASASSES